MEKLTGLEKLLIEKTAAKYPFILTHLPALQVKKREFTGVGMYVYFQYSKAASDELLSPLLDGSYSTSETINFNSLKYGLNYEIDITDGRVNFLELVSNGEEWDGEISEYFTIS